MAALIRALMAAHPTVGHTGALRSIGVRLKEDGHAIAFCIAAPKIPLARALPEQLRTVVQLRQAIADDGFELCPVPQAPSGIWQAVKLTGKTGYDELEGALKLFTTGLSKQAEAIGDHARRWKADVIVGDYLMPAAMFGAELAGLPFVALYHSALPFPVKGAAPFGSGLPDGAPKNAEWQKAEGALVRLSELFDARLSEAARELGVGALPRGVLNRPLSPELNLLNTHAVLEPGLEPLHGRVLMTGPCLPKAKPAERDDPALKAFGAARPRLYVSLGTVFNDQPEVFRTILDGIAKGPGQTVVSAGASAPKLERRASKDVHIFRRVPQVPLLAQTDAVITHGGNNTVQETLAAGRPMVVVPFGGDQLANARRVERLGVGAAILPKELSADTVRAAIDRALSPACVAKAKEIGRALEGIDGAANAAKAIVELVAKHHDHSSSSRTL